MRKLGILKLIIIFSLGLILSLDAFAQTPIDIRDDLNVTQNGRSSDSDESGACQYVDGELKIDPDVFNHENILMGVSNPKDCPLPGADFFPPGYPNMSGEFLFSGVVCVTQSIILDSMFRVYCTILLWMYQILYSMMILYVMFYGLVIMFDLSNEPLKEAPKRLLKILFIFFLAVNAEWGFTWIHKSFTNFLNDFSNILTRIQPLYTEGGEAAYRWDKDANGGNGDWILLDLMGNDWRPPDPGSKVCTDPWYYDSYCPGNYCPRDCSFATSTVASTFKLPAGYATVAATDYIPFRVPTQSWNLKKVTDSSGAESFKAYPVFVTATDVASFDPDWIDCISDVRFDPQEKMLVYFPRCQSKNQPTLPLYAPLGAVVNRPTDGSMEFFGHGTFPNAITYPMKVKKDATSETQLDVCDEENEPETCRQPFQGILGKIDAMFNSVVGDDNAKGLGAMATALILWGAGGGFMLAMLLMSGITSMFVAFIQILWTYATSMMGLTFLMMLAPIFISFSLFKATERLFRAWVGSLISFALQPILILGFIYVLASASTLDRLTELAKHEVSNVAYEFKASDGINKVTMNAPGFLKPLYELPPTSPDTSDPNAAHGYEGETLEHVGASQGLMKKDDRDKYREEGAKIEKDRLALTIVGKDYDKDFEKNNELRALLDADPRVKELEEMFKTPVEAPHPLFPGKIRTLVGANALKYHYDVGGITWLEPFVTNYQNKYGFDDGDGFPGEPINPEQPKGEFPTCKKYCPEFKPGYDVADASTINPDPAACTSFCMYIYDNKKDMFNYVVGAVLIWIILNVMTGAFMSRVPELAKRLANWQNMASQTPAIGGAGESTKSVSSGSELVEEGTGGFTVKERTGVYSGGSIWGLGIGPSLDGDVVSKPGAVPAALEKLTRLGKKRKIYDPQRGWIKVDEESIWDKNRDEVKERIREQERWTGSAKAVEKYLKTHQEVQLGENDSRRKKLIEQAYIESRARNLTQRQIETGMVEGTLNSEYRLILDEAARNAPKGTK